MNAISSSFDDAFVPAVDCQATLARLIGNLSGFFYRRRLDPRWTMEFISVGCRDITGYDPHRFIANASIAFADLIARSDWKRVSERVNLAVLHRRSATVKYQLRTAHGAWLKVEDRFAPVIDVDGHVIAIEGIIDRARSDNSTLPPSTDEPRLDSLCASPSRN